MSETNNQYWNGERHAVLTRHNVSARWGSGSHSGIRIDAANRAFCIWYHAQQTLAESAGQPHWTQMYRSLTDCAEQGWGLGVSDLREALHHIDRNNGRWTDDNTKTYFGGEGKSYRRSLINDMPEACANFLAAVDDKLPEVRTTLQEYQSRCQALQQFRPGPAQSSSDWERIKSNIDAIKTSAERAKPLLWLVPAAVTATVPLTTSGLSARARVEAFADGATSQVSRAISFLDVVGNIHDSMTVYVQATQALGGDRRAGMAFAALSYAMTFVPVLGTFYGTIVQKIPGLITSWREFIRDYTRRFDDPVGWIQERASRPPAWQCEICGSSGGYA